MTADLLLAMYCAGAMWTFVHLYRLTWEGWLSLIFACVWPITVLGMLLGELLDRDGSDAE